MIGWYRERYRFLSSSSISVVVFGAARHLFCRPLAPFFARSRAREFQTGYLASKPRRPRTGLDTASAPAGLIPESAASLLPLALGTPLVSMLHAVHFAALLGVPADLPRGGAGDLVGWRRHAQHGLVGAAARPRRQLHVLHRRGLRTNYTVSLTSTTLTSSYRALFIRNAMLYTDSLPPPSVKYVVKISVFLGLISERGLMRFWWRSGQSKTRISTSI